MNDLANIIFMIPVESIASIRGNELTLKNGASLDLFLIENDVKVSDVPETKDLGELFNQNSKVVVEKMSTILRKKYSRNRQVIVVLVKTNDDKIVWGSLDYPVTCSITPSIEADQIALSRKALQPIL